MQRSAVASDLVPLNAPVFTSASPHGVKGSGIKFIFGVGTKLKVESPEEYAASYYKLKKDNVGVCLATGFSRFNTTKQSGRGDLFRDSQPVRISSDSLFNQVAQLQAGDEGKCEQGDSGPGRCEEALKQDEMVNMASLTVLGLRLLFLKTIVFNVLMTLRLWISH
ncbi:M1-specific T cell receptor alpha chain-like [Aulostomus maculatus]